MSHGSAISLTWLSVGSWRHASRKRPSSWKPCGSRARIGGEVEAEAVDAHVVGPVAQAVHHHLQHAAVAEIHGVAGASVVDVVPRVGGQPVVGGVVDALEGQGGTKLVALGGVVVDDVEDQLEPGIVQMRHHLLELGEGEVGVGRVAPGGGEEADRVVAPVVLQPLVEQVAVVDEGVDRQQLDRADAERAQVTGDLGAGQPGISAAQRLGQRRMALGQPAHMRLVDDGVLPGDAPPPVAPGEGRVDHAGLHRVGSAVALVEGRVVAALDLIAEQRRVPLDMADHLLGVGIDQQLVGIEAVACRRLVGTVHAVAVDRARPCIGQVTVPDLVGVLRQGDALDLAPAALLEQAELDLGGVGREQGKVDAQTVPGGAERIGEAF